MALLDEVTGVVVATVEAVVAGHITTILYFYEGLADWVQLTTSPPSVPVGTEFHLAVYWVNDGNAAITGHIDLTISKLDGTEVTPDAVENQDNSAPPGNGWGVRFAPVTLDQVGSYLGKATLSGEQA